MLSTNNPHNLQEGKKWLAALQARKCSNFRSYLSYIRDAVSKGRYTYDELGSSEEEILMRAIEHASEDARDGQMYQLRLKNDLICELSKLRGAHRLPDYAIVPEIINLDEVREIRKAA